MRNELNVFQKISVTLLTPSSRSSIYNNTNMRKCAYITNTFIILLLNVIQSIFFIYKIHCDLKVLSVQDYIYEKKEQRKKNRDRDEQYVRERDDTSIDYK